MVAKYQCPKCERRFVEWGAEKLDFKCPHCTDGILVRVGARPAAAIQSPKLKRRPAKAIAPEEEDLVGVEVEVEEEEVEVVEEVEVPDFEVHGTDAEEPEAVIVGEPEPHTPDIEAPEPETEEADETDEVLPDDLEFDDEGSLEPADEFEEDV